MAGDNVNITPGSGVSVCSDQITADGSQAQVVKFAISADGDRTLIPATVANGMTVDVTRIQGNVTVVQPTASSLKVDASGVAVPVTDNAGSLTVDAPATTPVFVRLSSGTAAVDTIPVSVAATLNVAGTVAISGTPAVSQSGTWNIGTVATITNAVTVTGTVALSGTSPVSGTVTANQGTAAAIGNSWNVKVGDGTNSVGVSDVSGSKALKVDVIQSVGNSSVVADKSAFVEGTGKASVAAGVFNDTISSDPAEDNAAALRITQKRGLHVNLRSAAGVEQGTNAAPVQVGDGGGSLTVDAPAGTPLAARLSDGTAFYTNFPTNITEFAGAAVVPAAAGIPKVGAVDEAGAAFSETNPLPVRNTYPDQTVWKAANTFGASETDQTIRTPGSGKRFVLCGLVITPTAAGALLKIYDGTNAAANMIYQGQPPVGTIVLQFPMPLPSAAVNTVLRYSTGASAAGDITAWGYEV